MITDAHSAASVELSGRVRRYAITMGFRMLCFVGLFFVEGWARWALLAAAVFLPYVAVLFANQADSTGRAGTVARGEPGDAPQLTTGPEDDTVAGEVVGEESRHWSSRIHEDDHRERRDRVA